MKHAKALLRVLILSVFIFGQIGTTAHAHSHTHDGHDHTEAPHDEGPHETLCAFCILAISSDELLVEDVDQPDSLDGPSFLKHSTFLKIDPLVDQQVGLNLTLHRSPKLASHNQYLDAARAPPLR